MEKITIRAFRALDEPDLCQQYIIEHARVLSDIGVLSHFPVDKSWCSNPGVIVVAAFHGTLGMVAGVRIEPRDNGHSIPLERYFSSDPRVVNMIEKLGNQNAEMCGLWNAHRFAGRGVPSLLMTAAVAVSAQTELRSLICLAAEYMVPSCEHLGFQVATGIGAEGEFRFPIPSIASYVMLLADLALLTGMSESKRKEILSLRILPEQSKEQMPKREPLEVRYELILNGAPEFHEISILRQRFAA